MSKRLEILAEKQHAIWAAWMRWMFEQGEMQPDGTWVMPKEKVWRWQRQMNTDYADLSEPEKQSDRDVVKEFDLHTVHGRDLVIGTAVVWYTSGMISQGKAAEITGLSRAEFIELLGEYDLPFSQATPDEIIAEAADRR